MVGIGRGTIETAVMMSAVTLATLWSAGPVAARMVDGLAGGPGQAPEQSPMRAQVDQTRLPVGDGKVVREPTVGGLWSCQQQFTGAGAQRLGPWVRPNGTFDGTAKATVDGEVHWPHQFTIEVRGNSRMVAGNNLPAHPTGVYPISPSDDAYQYDHNPNSIEAQTLQLTLPAMPIEAAQPTCAGGSVGVLLSGSYLFNAVDAAGRDAVAHETQDACQGHPAPGGRYHYHSLTGCLDGGDPAVHSPLMGYAFDGFGIYGQRGEGGAELSNADLDVCHGHTHLIEWDGQQVELFHYHATYEFPYTVGCFRGRAAQMRPGGGAGGPAGGAPGGPAGGASGGGGPGAPPVGGPPR